MILILAALLGVTLSWDAPTVNCDDAATPVTDLDHYVVPIFQARILRWETCTAEDGSAYPCPVYAKSITRYCVPLDGPPCGDRPFPCFWIGPLDPGPGEVLGWNLPEAFDHAGNTSAMCTETPPPDRSCIVPAWTS